LLLIAIALGSAELGALQVVRWSEESPFANSYYYNGVSYRSLDNGHMSLSIGKPTIIPRARVTMVPAIFENHDIPRIDVTPEQFSCSCMEKGGKLKPLKPYNGGAPNVRPFLANSHGPGGRHGGILVFNGSCKKYLMRWEYADAVVRKALEFEF
jgi:hypothetical protein